MNGKKRQSVFGMLMGFTKGSRAFFLIAIIAAGISILFNFLLPRVVGFTVDSVIGTEQSSLPGFLDGLINALGGRDGLRQNLIICALGVIFCAIVSGIFNFFSRLLTAKGTENFTRRMRDSLFAHVQRLPFSWHTETLTGDIIQRCTSDVETARRFVSQQLIEVVRTVILLILALVMMFSINVELAIISGAFIPVIILYTMFFNRKITDRFLECDEAEGRLMVRVQENLTGVRVVRAFGRERYERDTFDDKNEEYTGKWLKLGTVMSVYWGVGDIVSASQLLTVVTVGAYMAATGKVTLGTLLIFISYVQTMGGPVRQMGRVLSEMSKTGVAFRRIKEIFDNPEEDMSDGKSLQKDGDIVFDGVSFSYGGTEVLKDVSFTIKSGTVFGILGETGSGKSTLIHLLNRLYDVPEGCGRITIGGTDIRDIGLRELRSNIGIVLQEPFLFSKTIFENIDIAAGTGDMEKVVESARNAAVHDDIVSFPHGYDTVVGERGVTLSGGQKQRIAIARTLMQNCPIIIFDDSMSNLDMETDVKIRKFLKNGIKGATVIIVSHRISTLMDADQILVLENGRVAELGSHRQLLKENGTYRRVYDLQSMQARKGDK